MIAIPPRPASSGDDVRVALSTVIRTAYGSLAASALHEDVAAFCSVRDRARSKGGAKTEVEAVAAEEALVLYGAVLAQTQNHLGVEVREQKVDFDLVTERMAALFNLASSYSLRGSLPAMADADAIKTAARHFQLAAGALEAAQELVKDAEPDARRPSDLAEDAIAPVRTLMLAQAQACFCEKAALDKLGAATQRKLCAGAAQLYQQAADAFTPLAKNHKPLHDWGAAVAAGRGKYYDACARWQAAEEALAAQQYGVRQSQLQLCCAALQQAQAALGCARRPCQRRAHRAHRPC